MLKPVFIMIAFFLALNSTLALTFDAYALADSLPTVTINGKAITGTLEPDHYIAYRGIKYAQAPVGELRWAPPAANIGWADKGVFDKYEATCATKDTLGYFGKKSDVEDCLYVNVFLPAKKSADGSFPVLAWIHGGGLSTGSGNDYNPAFWTDRGIAVVTFNYRVGVFGFFSDPALDEQNDKRNLDSINYGFMDQQEALRWIQRNISSFGGDPKNVTIFGESAGGSSVLSHMVAPDSAGLFHKAIASSGSDSMMDFNKYSQREIFSKPIIQNTSCKEMIGPERVSCLRSMTTQQMLDASISYLSLGRIVTGTKTMPLSIVGAFASGQFHHAPFMSGSNHDEGMLFAWVASHFNNAGFMSKDQFAVAIKTNLGSINAEKILKRMPPPDDGNYYNAAVRYLGDSRFVCRTPLIGQLAARYTSTYLYLFSPTDPPMYFNAGFKLLAAHTLDLPYLFKDFAGGLGYPARLDAAHQKLSTAMMDSFAAFLKTGKPGAMNGEEWSATSKNQEYMMLENDSQKMHSDYAEAKHCLDPDIALVLDSPFY